MKSLTEFDRPLFKKLAHNDTGQAAGHQAGFLVPKDLEDYFPTLSAQVTAQAPTVSENVTAFLFHRNQFLAEVQTRYQYQTWGGTRTPERRMTGNLTPLLGVAAQDDILLMERGIADSTVYRFTLIKHNDPEYTQFSVAIGTRRWGTLSKNDPPAQEPETSVALAAQVAKENAPFGLFDQNAPVIESHSRKVSRSRAFQTRLVALYGGKCAMCGSALVRPDGKSEAEAAHIVSRSLKGTDDARNGLLLCRAHHWAFDQGLISLDNQRKILVSPQAQGIPENQSLLPLAGHPAATPQVAQLLPDLTALEWHRANIFRA
jgi:putative restriction endonuclease